MLDAARCEVLVLLSNKIGHLPKLGALPVPVCDMGVPEGRQRWLLDTTPDPVRLAS